MSTKESSATSGQVEVNGVSIYYEEYGSAHPLLMLHGGTGTGLSNWKDYIPVLSDQYRVIIPDFRGHGKSTNPTGELSYEIMAEDMKTFLDVINVDNPLICGWSDGGQVALEIGMRYPGLPKAMIVGGAWYKLSKQLIDSYKILGMNGPGDVDFEHLEKGFADAVEFWKQFQGEKWQQLLIDISHLWYHDLNYNKDDLAKITCPTMILLGDRDEFISVETAVEIYRMLSDGELVIIPNATHSVSRSEVENFTRIMVEFFGRRGE